MNLLLISNVSCIAVLLSYCPPDPSPCRRHTQTPPHPASHSTITICFHPSVWSTVIASPHPHPHLTVFYLSLFFSLPCFSPFLLSVSIGGHGLGKPTEQLQNVEELLQLSFFLSAWRIVAPAFNRISHSLSLSLYLSFSSRIVLSPIPFFLPSHFHFLSHNCLSLFPSYIFYWTN